MKHSIRNERGQALVETAVILPIVLLLSVGIFEFGRAYQTSQVLTNAAREGARLAVMPGTTPAQVQARVETYLLNGQVGAPKSAKVVMTTQLIDIGGGNTTTGTRVQVNYPFNFIMLNGIAKLVKKSSTTGAAFTMVAQAEMRNE